MLLLSISAAPTASETSHPSKSGFCSQKPRRAQLGYLHRSLEALKWCWPSGVLVWSLWGEGEPSILSEKDVIPPILYSPNASPVSSF